ncbi:hypothetical protein JOQ06_005400 [Pogonophryne albipinna]|uniref:BED-type domain-containing protein n=1 Tax=Pogonophryne albipinna TaxID=1090488 RepID=A0AAD6BHG7_9TELE|nr:hypothetical protein JOQ06_005400 [Pogonophryne albipinna]
MSAAWRYFKISEKEARIAICKTCSADISRGGVTAKTFTTSGLLHHLKSKHPDKYAEYDQITSAQKKKVLPSTPTPSVADLFEKVARKYLSAPCTSTDSERLFSAASHVLDEKRNRLMADKAEKLLFIKKNLPLFLNK